MIMQEKRIKLQKNGKKVTICHFFAVPLQSFIINTDNYETIRRISALRREHCQGQRL